MSSTLARLEKELGSCVRSDPATLAAHRHDRWVLSELLDLEGEGAPRPLAVIEARSVDHVQRTLRLCRELRIAVIPFGGGSGVCGAIQTHADRVVLSTRGLSGLIELSDGDLTARFAAGTMGDEAEREVQDAGLTIGHWPQSIELSTVGGWVATRAAGQYSTAYGNIEDLVLALEVVLPDGSLLRTRDTPRAATGPDLRQLFMGSEGTLGVVTDVTFSLRPLPEESVGQAFHLPSFEAGVEALRGILRAGWRPPVLRFYDAAESARHFSEHCPEGRLMLILVHEGPRSAVEAQRAGVATLCAARQGVETDSASVDHWLEQRNRVPSQRALLERGIIADTIEVATTWDRVVRLYERVTESLRDVAGVILASGHSSHSYRSGTNLYFTFAARPDDPAARRSVYLECWRRTMAACTALGAGIAHHHGIGRVRRDVLVDEIGPSGVRVLRALKQALDPDGLLNPGALLPESDLRP
ncbi:MAG: FAD-binding oxidoreductase [Myxococcota bacterium]